jgi:hypothetical protein
MPYSNSIASPEQLAVLRAAVNNHCDLRNITDPVERENIAYLVMALFNDGSTTLEGLTVALAKVAARTGR